MKKSGRAFRRRVLPGPAFFLVVLAASVRSIPAQEPASWGKDLRFSTFSIAAVDPETGEVGVAVSTRVPCVGNVVPHVRAGVGAVATQAATRAEYGPRLLDMVAAGTDPSDAVNAVLSADPNREQRQLGVIAVTGRSAQFTGRQAHEWAGHRAGPHYIAQGNLLVGPEVLRAVGRAFEASANSGRHLADRLIDAIAAGELVGGDARKGLAQSAAVLVADVRPGSSHRPDMITTDVNICEHADPVAEMRRVYDAISEKLGYRTLQQFHGYDIYQLRLMLHALGYYKRGEPEPRPDLTSHFYTPDLIAAVNAFRAAEKLAGPALGSPPGLVDRETVERLWAALRRRGLDDDMHRRLREMMESRW